MVRILIVEDDEFTASGLGEYLAGIGDFEVAGIARSGQKALVLLPDSPDVVILDVKLPDMDGEALLMKMMGQAVRPSVLVFSASDDVETVQRMVCAGADGYFVKGGGEGSGKMAEAVRAVAGGGSWFSACIMQMVLKNAAEEKGLTPRQAAMLRLVAQGKTNQQIAVLLGISKRTVDAQMGRILKKLHAQNRAEACMCAKEKGWLRY